MIIADDNVDYEKIWTYVNRPEAICNYAESLVPSWCKHLDWLVMNQRYYLAVHIRNLTSMPYKKRKALVDNLIQGIKLSGIVSEFITIYTVLSVCNLDLLRQGMEALYSEKYRRDG